MNNYEAYILGLRDYPSYAEQYLEYTGTGSQVPTSTDNGDQRPAPVTGNSPTSGVQSGGQQGGQALSPIQKSSQQPIIPVSNKPLTAAEKQILTRYYEKAAANSEYQPTDEEIALVERSVALNTDDFNTLLKTGEIPSGSRQVVSGKPGVVQYQTKETVQAMEKYGKDYFKQVAESKKQSGDKTQTAQSTGRPVDFIAADKAKLNSVSDTTTATYSPEQLKLQGIEEPDWKAFAKSEGEGALGMIPIVGTAVFWNQMSTPWKIVSIASDALFFAPMIGDAVRTAAKGGHAVTTIDDAIRAGAKDTSAALRQVRPDLQQPFETVVRTQAEYGRDLLRVKQAEKILGPAHLGEVKAQALARIDLEVSTPKLQKSEQAFMEASQKFSARVNRLGDDPLIATEMKRLPDNLRNSTQQLVREVVYPRDIKAIKADFNTSVSKLRQLKSDYPDKPAMWQPQAEKAMSYHRELLTAQAGGVAQLHDQLVEIRHMIPKLEAKANEAIRTGDRNAIAYQRTLRAAKQKADMLPGYINDNIAEMELEWGEHSKIVRTAKELLAKGEQLRKGATKPIMWYETGSGTKLLESRKMLKGESGYELKPGEKPLVTGDVVADTRANRQFIQNANDILERVKSPERRAKIQEQIQQAKKQLRTVTKTETEPFRTTKPIEEGQFPLSKTEKTAKELTGISKETPKASPKPNATPKTSAKAPGASAFPGIVTRPKTQERRQSAVVTEHQGAMTPEQRQRQSETTSSEPSEDVRSQTVSQTSPAVRAIPYTKPQEQPAIQTRTKPQEKPVQQTQQQQQSATETETKTGTQTQTDTETKTTTRTPTGEFIRTGGDERLKSPTPSASGVVKEGTPTSKQLQSATAWPQGFGWWVVWKQGGQLYRKFYKGRRPPAGVQNVRRGPGEAKRGVQDPRGGGELVGTMPMGAVRVNLSRAKHTPGESGAIRFSENETRITEHNPQLSKNLPRLTEPLPKLTKAKG